MLEHLSQQIAASGFAVIPEPQDDDQFAALARELGEVLDDTLVRIVPGRRTYLASPAPIPFHTDHPRADLIAWRCEAQDADDGASLLVDGWAVLDDIGEVACSQLGTLSLPAMVRLGDTPEMTTVVAERGTRRDLFFAPWLEPVQASKDAVQALCTLQRALEQRQRAPARVRLREGQVLIADNRRMLHGRGALGTQSSRRLRRLWIRRPT